METILNLIWLGITLGVVWVWRFRWVPARPGRNPGRTARMEAVAMVCLVALLFPVISLTDDLHPEIMPADSVSSKRNHCLLVAQAAHDGISKSPSKLQPSFALLLRSHPGVELVFASLFPSAPILQSVLWRAVRIGRAPPCLV